MMDIRLQFTVDRITKEKGLVIKVDPDVHN
jgi:hypothetical protein